MVGLLGLASLVPLLVVPLIGGALADAVDRRTVLLRTETGMAIVAALFLANSLLDRPRVWALFVLQALAVTIFSLGRPAMATLTPRLVPDTELEAAMAVENVYSSLASVGGPAVGGLLIAAAGVPWTYGIDLVTYAASFVALALLPRLEPAENVERPSLRAIAEGFRFLKGRQALIGIFVVDANAMVFGMPSALFPAIALHQLNGNAATVGYLYAAPYAGALIGSLFSGWTSFRSGARALPSRSRRACGASRSPRSASRRALWPALVLLAIAGGADFYSAVLRATILVRATPRHLLGRLSGIEFMQVASAPSLGDVEAGVLASLTSLRFSVVSGGVLCILGCVVATLALPGFVRYDSRDPQAA